MARRALSWRAKLSLLLVFFALFPLVLLSVYSLAEQARLARKQTLGRLDALVAGRAEAIDQFADFRRRDAERMAKLLAPFLVDLAEAQAEDEAEPEPPQQLPDLKDGEELVDDPAGPTSSSDDGEPTETIPQEPDPTPPDPTGPTDPADVDAPVDEARGALRRAVGLIAWDQEEYEEILVFDSEGRVVVSTFEAHEEHDASELRYFEMGTKGTYLEPVFLSPITGELTMVISTPIRDDDHRLLGVLGARLNLKRFFRLLNDVTGLGETGETVAGQVVDDVVLFTAPTRHDPDAALQTRIALGDGLARPLQEAARGNSGTGPQTDYRGVDVLAAWRHIPSLEWGLVMKIDDAEAMAPVNEARNAVIIGAAAILVLGVAAAFVVSRAFVQPLRHLREATERISRGDFEVSLDIRSRDEIGQLANSFERMVAAIKFFREHSRSAEDEEDALEADMNENDA